MNLVTKGKNIEIPEKAKDYITKKVNKFNRHLRDITEIKVELSEEKTRSRENRYVVEMTLDCRGTFLRGEERGADIFTAIDAAADMMDRQIRRYKERLDAGKKRRLSAKGVFSGIPEQPSNIVRVKKFPVKPMPIEEAIEQMELLGHDFHLFMNEDVDGLKVIYRRKGGDYGLLEPELD